MGHSGEFFHRSSLFSRRLWRIQRDRIPKFIRNNDFLDPLGNYYTYDQYNFP